MQILIILLRTRIRSLLAMLDRLRRYIIRRYLMARGVLVEGGLVVSGLAPRVQCDGQVVLGDGVSLMCFQGPRIVLRSYAGATLKIGDNSFINQSATLIATTGVTIGNNTKIGPHVVIHDTTYHEVDQGAGVRRSPISIGDSVWIGRGATILPGVTIGSHSVIGTGSVVTKSVPARMVVAGNPAREIRPVDCDDLYIRK